MYSIRCVPYFLLLLLTTACGEGPKIPSAPSGHRPQKNTETTAIDVSNISPRNPKFLPSEEEPPIILPEPIEITPPLGPVFVIAEEPGFPFNRLYPGSNIPFRGGGGGKQAPCGNGMKQGNEECDDGGVISRDGCSSSCKLELFGASFEGSDGLADLIYIEPATGIASVIGPIGFERVSAMDFSQDGILYATAERDDGSDTPVLITIDLLTGAGTEIGPLGGTATGAISDISFRNSDNVLFAYDADSSVQRLFTIDIITGAATLIGNTFIDGIGNAISFNLEDILFHSELDTPPNPDLRRIDQTTGVSTFVLDLLVGDGNDRFSAMDAQPVTGVMYGVLTSGLPSTSSQLTTINTDTGTVIIIGETTINLDALAWSR